MWAYYNKNIGTDNSVVAEFQNAKGIRVFNVYEQEGCYAAISNVPWIKNVHVTFSEARRMNTPEEEAMDAHNTLLCRLKHACEIIEAYYNDQVDIIKKSI